jgi:hypothetical protein
MRGKYTFATAVAIVAVLFLAAQVGAQQRWGGQDDRDVGRGDRYIEHPYSQGDYTWQDQPETWRDQRENGRDQRGYYGDGRWQDQRGYGQRGDTWQDQRETWQDRREPGMQRHMGRADQTYRGDTWWHDDRGFGQRGDTSAGSARLSRRSDEWISPAYVGRRKTGKMAGSAGNMAGPPGTRNAGSHRPRFRNAGRHSWINADIVTIDGGISPARRATKDGKDGRISGKHGRAAANPECRITSAARSFRPARHPAGAARIL